MHRAIALGILLTGCTDEKTSDDPLASLPSVRLAETLSSVPETAFIFDLLVVAFTDSEDPEACPQVAVDGDDYSAIGGCTDADGNAYEGGLTVFVDEEAALMTFDSWSIETTAFSWVLDGALSLAVSGADPGLLTEEELRVTMSGLDADDYGQREAIATYPGFQSHLPLDEEGNLDVFSGQGAPDFAGQIVEETLGALTLSGGYTQDTSVCENEATSGTLTFTGEGTASVTYDGASACDGCARYTLSDGSVETACVE